MEKLAILSNGINAFLDTLDENISTKKQKTSWFNELIRRLIELFTLMRKLKSKGVLKNYENSLLYIQQLISSLSFLISIFVNEIEVKEVLLEARNCALKQIRSNLNHFQDVLEKHKSTEGVLGCFIRHVDYALEKIGDIDCKHKQQEARSICSEAKSLILELLTHAMIIAQVALEEDCKMIRGSSLAVFEAIDWLINEVNNEKPNPCMVNVSVQTCCDKLCALERRVNNAVLKLSLKTFSEYSAPLEAIHGFCFNKENTGKKSELDDMVAEFDLHVDRIVQIGLFAVSCTTDKMNGIKIRSCLASLEALEGEVVPAFTAVLLNHSSHNTHLAMLLEEFWLKQAETLKKLVYHIIDPYAFCQVVYEENKEIVIRFSVRLEMPPMRKEEANVLLTRFMKQTKVLQNFIEEIIEEQQDKNMEGIKSAFKDFRNVFYELKWSVILLNQKSEATLDQTSYHKILKRCKVLQSTIKVLWGNFVDEDAEASEIDEPKSPEDSSSESAIRGNPFLNHIINRGRHILKDRSILYPDSEKNLTLANIQETARKKMSQLKGPNRSIPLSKFVQLRKLSFMNSTVENESNCGQLQYSDIIKELNDLSKTLSSLTKENSLNN